MAQAHVDDGPRSGRVIPHARKRSARVSAAPALRWTVVLLGAAALLTVSPLWAPIVMAAWTATIVRPLHARVSRRLGESHRAAALITVTAVLLGTLPIGIIIASLAGATIELVNKALASPDARAALSAVVGNSASGGPELRSLNDAFALVRQHGTSAWHALTLLAGATAKIAIGVFVFVLGLYQLLIKGDAAYAWLERHAPLEKRHFRRLADAFSETGRGLFIGIGLTALAQGLIAGIGYFALQIPQAAVLAVVTAFAALVPSAGAALVWGPVSAGLALYGRPGASLVMLAIGIVVSLGDNFLRPLLANHAKLRLPTFVLLVAMLGGIVVFGAWGLVLGPLLVRLAVEALEILREEPATA